MKINLGRVLLVPLAAVVLSVLPVQAQQGDTPKDTGPGQAAGTVPASTFEQPLIMVEDLAVEVHSDSGILTVSAKIKNVSRAIIKGYATVHLLSTEGKRLLSYEAEINDGEPFAHGTTVEFELTAQAGDIKNIASISVEFTKT